MRFLCLSLTLVLFCSFKPVKKYIQKAELAVERGNLKAAKEYYLKALEKDSANPRANYGLGLLYSELLENYSGALPYLEKAYSATWQDSLYELYYGLAKCYHHNGDYEKAIAFYNKLDGVVDLEREVEFPKEIRKRKEECAYAIAHRRDPADRTLYLVNAGKVINGETPEYGPVLTSSDQMIFTSKRKDHRREQLNYLDGKYFESMYVADITSSGFRNVRRYALPGKLMKPRFTNNHQAVVSLSQDGRKLFTFRNSAIYEIDISELSMGKPRKLVTTFSSKYYQNHAFLTKDGNTLYFTSDADGGLGGLDIYRCEKSGNGEWSKPENLGAPVNTEFDEDAPYLTEDGLTMYFASKGHPGFGNYDLYRSELRDGKWTAPENLGMPVNSPGHDIFLVNDSSGKVSYFSSGRNGGMGDMDIYRIVHLDKVSLDCVPLASGIFTTSIRDNDTTDYANTLEIAMPAGYTAMSYEWRLDGKAIDNPRGSFENDYKAPGTYTVSYRIVAGCDTCLWPVVACSDFINELRKPKDTVPAEPLPLTFDINTYKGELNTEHLDKLGFNDEPVLFGFDKSSLEPDAVTILSRNVAVLKKHRQLTVEIVGYTDSRGPDSYNLRLSQRRAKSVQKYLLDNGVDAAQIKGTNGKGSTELVNDCHKGRRCSESAHRQNRRVVLVLSVRN